MGWSVAFPALAGLVGVVVGSALSARLQAAAAYAAWRRDHLFELYTLMVPILRRLEGAVYGESEEATQAGLADMRSIIPKAEILCSPEALAGIKGAYSLLNAGGPPWWLTDEQRSAHVRKRPLGSRTATSGAVNRALTAM